MKLRVLLVISLFFTAGILRADPPRRIVSLAPSITENLYLLGAEDSLIAVTLFCPDNVRGKEIVGNLLEPNLEKIVSLAPDLVLATKEGNRKETVEQLRRLGITVFVFESEKDFNDIGRNFLRLGKLTGREKKAQDVLRDARRRIDAVQKKVRGREPVRVFWEIGMNPLFTVGSGTFVEDYNRCTGADNIFAGLPARYPQISREEVIARDPDVILLVTMVGLSPEEKSRWEKFGSMKAVRDKRVYVIDGAVVMMPTPKAFVYGVETIARLLYPELMP